MPRSPRVTIWHLIGWEVGANLLDLSKSSVTGTQCHMLVYFRHSVDTRTWLQCASV